MKYIGPFFRMNSISSKEIKSQLFFLSKEGIRHIVLHSGCGIIYESKNSKKSSSNDIIISKNFSPLLCIYKRGTPRYNISKSHNIWDKETMKKEIQPLPNAFMSLCLIELSEYYSFLNGKDNKLANFNSVYNNLAKLQLDFYATYLRNSEGLFITKKNIGKDNEIELCNKDKDFKLSEQAFMMLAYYGASKTSSSYSESFLQFAEDIKDMFSYYKEELYELSAKECLNITLAFNLSYKYHKNNELLSLGIDLTDYCLNRLRNDCDIDDDIESSSLLLINLLLSYKNTNLGPFKESAIELYNTLKNVFSEEEGIFIKDSDKKEAKYSCNEVITYLISIIMCEKYEDDTRYYNGLLNNIYRKTIINSSLISAFPEAPDIDNIERYKNFSKKSQDIVDEICFKMPNSITCDSCGLPPYFTKKISYNRKKECFSASKDSFYSSPNMYLMYLIIALLKKDYLNEFNLINEPLKSILEKNTCRSISDGDLESEIKNELDLDQNSSISLSEDLSDSQPSDEDITLDNLASILLESDIDSNN